MQVAVAYDKIFKYKAKKTECHDPNSEDNAAYFVSLFIN